MRARTKGILATLLVIAALAAVLYAAAPQLAAAIAVRQLEGTLDIRRLEISSITLSRVEIDAIEVEQPRLGATLRDATIRFDLWPFRLRSVDIRSARVRLDASRVGSGKSGAIAPPPFPVRVNALSLQTATPWGPASLDGASLRSTPGAAGGLDATLTAPGFSARVSNPAKQEQALTLRATDDDVLLFLSAHNNTDTGFSFDGRLQPGPLLAFLRDTPLLPSALPGLVSPYEIDGSQLVLQGQARSVRDFTLTLRGDLALRDTRDPTAQVFKRVELAAGPGYTLSRSGGAWTGSGAIGFTVAVDAQTTLRGRAPDWRWNEQGLSLSADAVDLEPLGLRSAGIRARLAGFDLDSVSGSLEVQGLQPPGWPNPLTPYDLNGEWSWRDSVFQARGQGSSDGLPPLDWVLSTQGPKGDLEVQLKDEATALAPILTLYTADLAPDLELVDGRIKGQYRQQWSSNGTQMTLSLNASSLRAEFGDMVVDGMEIALQNRDNGLERFTLTVTAPALQLAAGTVARDVTIDLDLAPPRVNVNTVSTRMFDGELSLRPTSFDLGDQAIELYMDIDSLSLEQVLALMDLQTTELTGAVSGPVRMVYRPGQGLEINQGELHSIAPGVLRFRMDPASSEASGLDNIALRALNNFQYQELSASVRYLPDGEYRIKARILGHNPEVLDGYPVAFNPDIQGQLPELFRAFFVTGDFSRAIIERLQQDRDVSTPGQTSTLDSD